MARIEKGDLVRYGPGEFDKSEVYEISRDGIRGMVCGGCFMPLDRMERLPWSPKTLIGEQVKIILRFE